MLSKPTILYFLAGFTARPEQRIEAESFGNCVIQYRNSHILKKDDPMEKADGVAGDVPAKYKDYPTAEEAMAKYRNQMVSKKKESGDVEAPEVTDEGDVEPYSGQQEESVKPPGLKKSTPTKTKTTGKKVK